MKQKTEKLGIPLNGLMSDYPCADCEVERRCQSRGKHCTNYDECYEWCDWFGYHWNDICERLRGERR